MLPFCTPDGGRAQLLVETMISRRLEDDMRIEQHTMPTTWLTDGPGVHQQRETTTIAPAAPTVRSETTKSDHEHRLPPEGALPNTSAVLSQLTPADRAAIAGATGYHLSPTGEITNPGGIPPWSFILGYAARATAEQVEEEAAVAVDQDGPHVDVVA